MNAQPQRNWAVVTRPPVPAPPSPQEVLSERRSYYTRLHATVTDESRLIEDRWVFAPARQLGREVSRLLSNPGVSEVTVRKVPQAVFRRQGEAA